MYALDPDLIGPIAGEVANLPRAEMLSGLVTRLKVPYGDHIASDPEWIFNLNGGATGAMALLHASLNEYLVVFGTPIGTDGFSGRYTVDIHDWVLGGELHNLRLDDPLTPVITPAGGHAFLARGDAVAFVLPPDSWLLEYGRGNVPSSLPRVLGDAAFRAQDPQTILDTLREFGSLATHRLFRSRKED